MDKIYFFYTLEKWCYNHHLLLIAVIIRAFIRIVFSADIPYKLQIGKGTKMPHDALGSVFHPDVKIGKNCVVRQGVTIGGRSGHTQLPVLEDFVDVGTHAQILGPIVLGHHSVIGAGAIVLKDVPPYAVVAGNPAKIIRINNPNDNLE